jgi:hypothetical protein
MNCPRIIDIKQKKKVFVFTTWILATSFWLKDSTGGDGGVRVVGQTIFCHNPLERLQHKHPFGLYILYDLIPLGIQYLNQLLKLQMPF